MKKKEFEKLMEELKSYFSHGRFGPHRIHKIIDSFVDNYSREGGKK